MTGVSFLMVMGHPSDNRGASSLPAGKSLVVARRARLRDRFTVRLRARDLDRALAAGVPAESTPALALRARRLTGLADRRSKAASFHRLLRAASADITLSHASIPPAPSVTAAADALSRLAEALARPGPIAPRGAAEATLLLSDGIGPLYNAKSRTSLESYAQKALADLTLKSAS
jgi:hypothetical protein